MKNCPQICFKICYHRPVSGKINVTERGTKDCEFAYAYYKCCSDILLVTGAVCHMSDV